MNRKEQGYSDQEGKRTTQKTQSTTLLINETKQPGKVGKVQVRVRVGRVTRLQFADFRRTGIFVLI